ncbi:MAG: hypothetical protein HYV60_25770, partial [Planctomycetia bacterium]|nr:hypothetical protein [Planctomycetia bacterium]
MRDPSSNRLKAGLTISVLQNILEQEIGRKLCTQDITYCLDHLVDRAIAVPKIIRPNGWIVRAFYCGEDTHDVDDEQIRRMMAEHYDELDSRLKKIPITPFEMQKALVIAQRVSPNECLRSGPYKFGYVVFAGARLIDRHLTSGSLPPFLRKTQTSGNRTFDVLTRNSAYKTRFENTRPPKEDHAFFEAFQKTLRIFRHRRTNSDMVLLLTTCNDCMSTFQAIAYELDMWRSNSSSLGKLIIDAQADLKARKQADDEVMREVFTLIDFTSEIQKKLTVWSKFDVLRERLDGVVAELPGVGTWWRAYV